MHSFGHEEFGSLWLKNPEGIIYCYNSPYWCSLLHQHDGENPHCACLTGPKWIEINAIFFITDPHFCLLPAGSCSNYLFHTPKCLIWQLNQSSWHTIIEQFTKYKSNISATCHVICHLRGLAIGDWILKFNFKPEEVMLMSKKYKFFTIIVTTSQMWIGNRCCSHVRNFKSSFSLKSSIRYLVKYYRCVFQISHLR